MQVSQEKTLFQEEKAVAPVDSAGGLEAQESLQVPALIPLPPPHPACPHGLVKSAQ